MKVDYKGGKVMKFRLIIAIAITIIIGGIAVCVVSTDDDKTSVDANKMKGNNLPHSLDQYYNEDKEYLIEMYKLGESMMGIPVNLGQGDFPNAIVSFNEFSECYEYSSEMVPEWKKYYDQKAVKKLGNALETGEPDAINKAMGKVGETCSECHLDTMTPVYNKYYWNDFRDVMIETPDGPMPWKQAKMYYLLMGFDGIGVNIKESDQDGAEQSFELFDSMFDNMTNKCSACHISEPKYFVSEDIQTMIDDMGTNIINEEYGAANGLRYAIGDSCHKCHIIHIPPQYAKVNGD